MSPLNKVRAIGAVVTLLLWLSCAVGAQAPVWWLSWSPYPTASEVEGIPVRALDESWKRASLTHRGDLPIAATEPGERPEDWGLSLVVNADLDGDGAAERAVVGVFETIQGQRGRFLLILGRAGASQSWQKRGLFQVTGEPLFSASGWKAGRSSGTGVSSAMMSA